MFVQVFVRRFRWDAVGLRARDRLDTFGRWRPGWLRRWGLCSASGWRSYEVRPSALTVRLKGVPQDQKVYIYIYTWYNQKKGIHICFWCKAQFSIFTKDSNTPSPFSFARISFVDALKNWRSSLRKSRSSGQETSDSAVKLWQASAKREAQKIEKSGKESTIGEKEEKEEKEGEATKKAKTEKPEKETEETKLNRSPTKVLLLTNLVSPTLEEDEIQSTVEKLVDFGKVHECKILKVPNVPEEDAVRIFLLFDSVQVSSKAYASLKGQVACSQLRKISLLSAFLVNETFSASPLNQIGRLAQPLNIPVRLRWLRGEPCEHVSMTRGAFMTETCRSSVSIKAFEKAKECRSAFERGVSIQFNPVRAHFWRSQALRICFSSL